MCCVIRCTTLHNCLQCCVTSVEAMCACRHDGLLSVAEFIDLHNRTQFVVDLLCVYVRLL